MKLVINSCCGGFGLSHEAIMRYGEIKGITLYPYINHGHDKKYIPYKNQKNPFSIFYFTKELENGQWDSASYIYDRDFERNDPVLIQVVEELGEMANGECAKLRIVEIPDNVKYEINDYDGIESVHEIHRSWG